MLAIHGGGRNQWNTTWEQPVMSTESNQASADREPTVVEGGGFEPQPLVDWHTLSEFTVQIHKHTKVSGDIYANGLQQAPIEIILQARDRNGVSVQLTHEQLYGVNGVRLITYETNAGVSRTTHTKDDRFVYQWPLAREDGEEIEQDAGPAETSKANGQSVFIYLSKVDLDTTWIAAEITSPSGTKFRTNTKNPPAGKFDSWVKLRGRPENPHKWNCFTMTREDAYNSTYWDVDLYYIRFIDDKYDIVASRHYGWSGHDKWHYAWLKGGNQVQHVCYGADEPRTVRHQSMAGSNYLDIRINKYDGQATAARISDARDYGNCNYDSCVMGYIDQHGNEGKVWIRGNPDGNTLYLDDPSRKVDETPPDEDGGG